MQWLDFDRTEWDKVIMNIERRCQSQKALDVQLQMLFYVANRLGLYDAADYIEGVLNKNEQLNKESD